MESSLIPSRIESNPDTLQESKRKKRRKPEDDDSIDDDRNNANSAVVVVENRTVKRWRTEKEQLIYSSKLIDALRHVRRRISSPAANVSGGSGVRVIRDTADRVLAVSAKGTTRWSRAILASRLRRLNKHKKVKKMMVTGYNRLKKKEGVRRERRRLPAVEEKVKILSRLVPGCRKLSFSNLLEEAIDYIPALEMQIRVMTALTEILAGAPVDRLGLNVNSS